MKLLAPVILVSALSTLLGAVAATARADSGDSDGLRKALALHDAGRYQEAIELYRSMLQRKPDDPLVLYEISFSYTALKDYSHCIEYARRASAIASKTQSGALALLANCQDDSGAREEALATFAKALKQFPKDVRVNFNYAVALSRMGNTDGARERLRTVIEQAPDYRSAYLAYAMALEADHAEGAAVYMYLRFLAFDPRGGCATQACKKVRELLRAHTDLVKKEVRIERPKPVKGESNKLLTTLNLALATSVATADSHANASEVGKAVEALANFVQIGHELGSNGEAARSFALSHTVPALHALADAGTLGAFLRDVMEHAEPALQTL